MVIQTNFIRLSTVLMIQCLTTQEALPTLARYKRPLLIHAEVQLDLDGKLELENGVDNARSYSTYLKTRPASM